MDGFRPALRADVELVKEEGRDAEALFDAVFGRRVALDGVMRAIVERMDGKRTLDEILAEVARAHPDVERGALEHCFRLLLLQNMIEGMGGETLARVRRVKAGEPQDAVVLEGSRFACQGSGECCQNYAFGPLSEHDLENITSRDIAKHFPQLGQGPFLEARVNVAEGAKTEWYLKTIDQRCVFLLEDRRCGLHAAFGPEGKPGFCRVYPIRYLPTIEGLKVFDGGECATFPISSRSGPLLTDDAARIISILPKKLDLYHPLVHFDARTSCDYGYFLKLQRALVGFVAARIGNAIDTSVALARVARAFQDAIASCPLAPGEPDAAIAAVFRRDPETFYPSRDRPSEPEGLSAIATIADNIIRVVMPAVAQAQPTREHGLSARLVRQFAEVVQLLQALAMHLAEPNDVPLPDYFREVMSVAADEPEIDEVLRLSFKNVCFGDRLLIDRRPIPGLARLSFVTLVTILGAKLHATVERSRRVRIADLALGHQIANRILRLDAVAKTFLVHEHRAWPAIEAVPALLRLAPVANQ